MQTALKNDKQGQNFAGASAGFRHILALATAFTQQREASSKRWQLRESRGSGGRLTADFAFTSLALFASFIAVLTRCACKRAIESSISHCNDVFPSAKAECGGDDGGPWANVQSASIFSHSEVIKSNVDSHADTIFTTLNARMSGRKSLAKSLSCALCSCTCPA